MLVLNVPATIGLVVLARPVVSLLLERGRFGPEDTAATAAALACYAPGLVGYSAVKIASPSFYALRDSRTPLVVSVIAVVTNVVLNLTLIHVMGYRGLALGTAVAATLNAALLLWILQARLGGLEARRTVRTLVSILAASCVMGLAAWLTQWLLELALPGGRTIVRAVRVFGRDRRRRPDPRGDRARARDRGDRRSDSAHDQAIRSRVTCRARHDGLARPAPSNRSAHGQRPHDGRRLRQHLRAAPAVVDPETELEPRSGRYVDDAVSDCGVGGAGRVWSSGGPLAATTAGDGRAGGVGAGAQPDRRGAHRCAGSPSS